MIGSIVTGAIAVALSGGALAEVVSGGAVVLAEGIGISTEIVVLSAEFAHSMSNKGYI